MAATFLFQIPGLIFLDREFVTFVWINYIIINSNLKGHIYILSGLEEHCKSSYPSIESIPAVSKTIVLDHVLYYIIIIVIISNGNRTEWSPIRSVIIRVINKIGRPRSGSPICLITSMITDRIGRHEVLLPINHNINKICDIVGYFLNQNTRNSKFCFASSEKKQAI